MGEEPSYHWFWSEVIILGAYINIVIIPLTLVLVLFGVKATVLEIVSGIITMLGCLYMVVKNILWHKMSLLEAIKIHGISIYETVFILSLRCMALSSILLLLGLNAHWLYYISSISAIVFVLLSLKIDWKL